MQDIFGSVRRSLVFRTASDNEDSPGGTLVDRINSCIRKSRVFSKPSPPLPLPAMAKENAPPIRWWKGELIGCGAFGRVYMGMNPDSGELLAVKQVLIAANSASKEKAQVWESRHKCHSKFVPGGSISSLLGKFGSFPEAVIRTYTNQLLLGLEYLHKNGIMLMDIKGANILVDNKGCIKLADFGASKQVVELATISGAKSMKGTPYWMAPEVILQTGHSFSADIWSVGCTVIEMATGKPPWSQQYQEVAALFHIGTTKSHPPIPEHLSFEAKDFLLKCLQREPHLRSVASELLQHPFVTGEHMESHPVFRTSVMEDSGLRSPSHSPNLHTFEMSTCPDSDDMCNLGSLQHSTIHPNELLESRPIWERNSCDDGMCQIDDEDMVREVKLSSSLMLGNIKIPEVFYYAQKAVLHPTGPLFDQETQTLKDQCVRALKRIFILCDHDRDGALSDAELNDFQVKCFNAPLQPSEIVGVKRVVQEKLPEGVNEHGLTLTGFLFLHALFIEKGRLETTWTVLWKFGYNNDIRLADELIPSLPKRSPDQSVELTNEAIEFLKAYFDLFDSDGDGALRPRELEELFSTAPASPFSEFPCKDAAFGGLSLDGFLSQAGKLFESVVAGREIGRKYMLETSSWIPYEKRRLAYVTILHSSEAYVCGAIALAQSIRQTNSTKDLVLLANDSIM